MPVDPYVPADDSALPSNARVIFAANDNTVQEVKASIITRDGSTVVAYWTSPTLNRESVGHAFSLTYLRLFYSAAGATTITVHASGDGGNNWVEREYDAAAPRSEVAAIAIDDTSGEIRSVVLGFIVTGYDLRFRIQFTTDVIVKIFGYMPTLVRRGLLDASDYATS